MQRRKEVCPIHGREGESMEIVPEEAQTWKLLHKAFKLSVTIYLEIIEITVKELKETR